jgi:hypothetical protein
LTSLLSANKFTSFESSELSSACIIVSHLCLDINSLKEGMLRLLLVLMWAQISCTLLRNVAAPRGLFCWGLSPAGRSCSRNSANYQKKKKKNRFAKQHSTTLYISSKLHIFVPFGSHKSFGCNIDSHYEFSGASVREGYQSIHLYGKYRFGSPKVF